MQEREKKRGTEKRERYPARSKTVGTHFSVLNRTDFPCVMTRKTKEQNNEGRN